LPTAVEIPTTVGYPDGPEQRGRSGSARCPTKSKAASEECFEERRASVNVCRLCITVSPSDSCSQAYSHSQQALQSHSVEAAQALAALLQWRRELPTPRLRLRASPSPPRNRLPERLCSRCNQLRLSRRPCRRRPPLQEAARSPALDPPVWAAPVARAGARKAPRAGAATRFGTA
jgi:hypothetical protein